MLLLAHCFILSLSLVVFRGYFKFFFYINLYFISRKKPVGSAFFLMKIRQKNTGITVNIKVQWRYLYPGRGVISMMLNLR